MKKICVVVASRANYGRIKSVLTAINEHPDLELQLVVGASALLYRFGRAIDVIRADGFSVTAQVYSIIEGENPTTMAKSTGLGIIELSTLFENLKPDIVLTVADRFETLATAVAASYMNIPVAHTQGGEVTGSIDESVRHAITKLSHLHFVATDESRERVIRMGENPSHVHNTGCPAIDAVAKIDLSLPLDFFASYGGTGQRLDPTKPYLVVLQHPVTTEFGSGLSQINETLEAVRQVNIQTAWLWPNVDAGSDDISKGLRMFRERHREMPLQFFRNFSVEDYARLIANAECLVGNSSSGLREGAFLGVPVVNIGTRQHNRERGINVVDVSYDHERIHAAILAQMANGRYPSQSLFGDGRSGTRIADLLASEVVSVQKAITY
ncbi:MAG: UDP-N-acetylglucosamine 2-epimerase [Proteobacteria bacterium]|nr:UDP-N-acetylglucosamine 2-epimerase [Pseudomonadota bacterium]